MRKSRQGSRQTPQTALAILGHPSPHRIQWERALRWRKRSASAIAHGETPEAFDCLFALFGSISDLRNWIKASRPELRSEVERLYAESADLALVRDIANGAKHMTLHHYAVDGSATVAREYVGDGQWRVLIPRPGGRNIEGLQLAGTAMGELEAFMGDRGLH